MNVFDPTSEYFAAASGGMPHGCITIRRKLIMTVTDDRVTWTYLWREIVLSYERGSVFYTGSIEPNCVFPRIIINIAHMNLMRNENVTVIVCGTSSTQKLM